MCQHKKGNKEQIIFLAHFIQLPTTWIYAAVAVVTDKAGCCGFTLVGSQAPRSRSHSPSSEGWGGKYNKKNSWAGTGDHSPITFMAETDSASGRLI